MKEALNTLREYSTLNGLVINVGKTKFMKFGNGGPPAAGDIFHLDDARIEKVTGFSCLGIEIFNKGVWFFRHVHQRVRKARLAFHTVPKAHVLSVKTALVLFELKIAPIASYGIQIIWPYLSPQLLNEFDKLKAAYLKRVLSVHHCSRNRLVYWLTWTELFTEDLREKFYLPATAAYEANREQWLQKMFDIEPEFLNTPAMTNRSWMSPGCSFRHKMTRTAVHGFHHIICNRKGDHHPDGNCLCLFCAKICDRYHIYSCTLAFKEAERHMLS